MRSTSSQNFNQTKITLIYFKVCHWGPQFVQDKDPIELVVCVLQTWRLSSITLASENKKFILKCYAVSRHKIDKRTITAKRIMNVEKGLC